MAIIVVHATRRLNVFTLLELHVCICVCVRACCIMSSILLILPSTLCIDLTLYGHEYTHNPLTDCICALFQHILFLSLSLFACVYFFRVALFFLLSGTIVPPQTPNTTNKGDINLYWTQTTSSWTFPSGRLSDSNVFHFTRN